jgi:hypothetical protein
MQGDELDQFVRDMLAAKNLPGLEDDNVRDQFVDDLKEEILAQVDRAIVQAIPEDKLDGFNALLDDDATSDEALQSYVAQCGVDTQQVATDTMTRFRELYLTQPGARGD